MASDQTDEQVLEQLWRSPAESVSLFSDHFLAEVLPDKLRSILIDGVERCGVLIDVEKTDEAGEFRMVTERCEIPTEIARDEEGKVDGLLFHHPVRRDASLDDLLKEIASLEGSVSYGVFENGELIAGHDPDGPMAVGSSFKLIVLAALQERIEEGEAAWSDVVTLEKKLVSLPSGELRKMPIIRLMMSR